MTFVTFQYSDNKHLSSSTSDLTMLFTAEKILLNLCNDLLASKNETIVSKKVRKLIHGYLNQVDFTWVFIGKSQTFLTILCFIVSLQQRNKCWRVCKAPGEHVSYVETHSKMVANFEKEHSCVEHEFWNANRIWCDRGCGPWHSRHFGALQYEHRWYCER